MTLAITQEPAEPRSTIDGVVLTVTGEVAVPSHLAIKDADGVVRGVSPVFSQGMEPRTTNQVVTLEISGAGGGSFILAATDPLEIEYRYSDDIDYEYSDDDIVEALEGVLPAGSIVTASTDEGVTTIEIKGQSKQRPWLVVADDAELTGDDPAITIEEVTAGGDTEFEAAAAYKLGPLFLDEDRAAAVYLYADADGVDSEDTEIEEGDELASLALTFA